MELNPMDPQMWLIGGIVIIIIAFVAIYFKALAEQPRP